MLNRIALASVLFMALPDARTARAEVVAQMTPDAVRAAIADQKTPGCYPLKKGGMMSFRVTTVGCFTTPYSRVAGAAQRARKTYKPFTAADVSEEMLRPIAEVIAFPQSELVVAGQIVERGMLSVQAVVIAPEKSKDPSTAILPTSQEETSEQYQNAYGANWQAKSITATFPLAALQESNEVRVVYPAKACADNKNKLLSECAVGLKLKDVK